MTSGQRPWRGVAPDERQLERRRRLLDAALELTDTSGTGAVTVRGVCTQAGLTSRYFYESFTDTTDLLHSLYDELASHAIAIITDAVAVPAEGRRARVRGGISAGLGFITSDPRRGRFLLVAATSRPDLNERRRRLIADVADLSAAAALRDHHITIAPTHTATTSRFVIGGMIEVATAYVEDDLGTTAEQLIDTQTDIVLSLIDSTLARAPSTGT